MKPDITGRKEIELLINRFYEKVKADAVIGHFFLKVNWEHHLPVMYAFWENALFYTGGYSGNPLHAHKVLHQRNPLKAADFERWQELFIETVNECFEGEKADLVKQRALSIATVMQIKIL